MTRVTESAKKLAVALRSGEYDQANGVLRGENGYCCLGVACDLYAKETGEGRWEWSSADLCYAFRLPFSDGGESYDAHYLPVAVRDWLRFKSPRGLWGSNIPDSLSHMNDTGTGFDKIADIIENEDSLYEPSLT